MTYLNEQQVLKQGFLFRLESSKYFRRRWIVLTDVTLQIYREEDALSVQDIETPIEIIHAEDLCQVVGDLPHLAMARAGRQVAAKANTFASQKRPSLATSAQLPAQVPKTTGTLRKGHPPRSLRTLQDAAPRQHSMHTLHADPQSPVLPWTESLPELTPLEPILAQKHPFRFDLHVRRHGSATSVLSFSAESQEQAQTWSMLLYTFLADAQLLQPDPFPFDRPLGRSSDEKRARVLSDERRGTLKQGPSFTNLYPMTSPPDEKKTTRCTMYMTLEWTQTGHLPGGGHHAIRIASLVVDRAFCKDLVHFYGDTAAPPRETPRGTLYKVLQGVGIDSILTLCTQHGWQLMHSTWGTSTTGQLTTWSKVCVL